MRLHDKSGLISSSNAEDNKSQNADTNNELNQNNEANNNSFGNDKSDMDWGVWYFHGDLPLRDSAAHGIICKQHYERKREDPRQY